MKDHQYTDNVITDGFTVWLHLKSSLKPNLRRKQTPTPTKEEKLSYSCTIEHTLKFCVLSKYLDSVLLVIVTASSIFLLNQDIAQLQQFQKICSTTIKNETSNQLIY